MRSIYADRIIRVNLCIFLLNHSIENVSRSLANVEKTFKILDLALKFKNLLLVCHVQNFFDSSSCSSARISA